jgi:hypothetical protein
VLLDKDDGDSGEAIENATWPCVKAISLFFCELRWQLRLLTHSLIPSITFQMRPMLK